MTNTIPVLAFVGHGRAGKDTASEWFRDNTVLTYKGGCSWTARTYMAKRLSEETGVPITPDEAYATRHGKPGEDPNIMRMKWYNYMNEYREKDPALLIRDCRDHSNIICGVRDRKELIAAKEEGLIDLIVWIENNRVPPDPTVTFTIEDADIVILNNGTLEEFYAKLNRLAEVLLIKSE